jgi:putative ABC transport system permease protein
MLPLYRTLSLRYLSRRWVRAALIVASIALGVAALVATRALNDTMSSAALASSNPMAGVVDLIVSNGELPVDRALADELEGVAGVKAVQPRLYDSARLVIGAEKRNVLVLGIAIEQALKELDGPGEGVTLSEGVEFAYLAARTAEAFGGPPPVVVGQELERELPADGKRLILEKNNRTHELLRVGSIRAGGDLAALGGFVLVLDQDTAGRLLGFPSGQVSRLDVVLCAGVSAATVRPALEEALRGRAQVRTPAEQNESLQSAMAGMRTGFAMGGIATLIVGMFLVYNALSVSVAERRHEIGILLAVGATREQVGLLFTGEALLLGLAGSLVGIPLGIGLAYLGLQPMQEVLSDMFTTVNSRQVEVTPSILVNALFAGMVAAVLASLLPALQASRERPAEAVRRIPKAPTLHYLFLQMAASALLCAAGVLLILLRGHIPQRLGTFWGMGLVLVGALLAAPIFASLTARLLQPLARRAFPIAWRLAADNLVRAPGRTGMVIGALAAGVALVVQTAGVIRSNRQALRDWVQDSIAADVIVTSGSPVGSGGQSTPMDESIGAELRKFPEVEGALPVRFCKVLLGEVQVSILTTDAGQAYELEKTRLAKRSEADLYPLLEAEPNAVLVSDNFPPLHGKGVGDTIVLPGRHGEVKLKIVGTIPDYSWALGTIIMHRRDYLANWGDAKVDVFDVYLHKGADPVAVKQKIAARLGAQYDLHPLTKTELQGHIDQMIDRFYSIAYAQQVVVMLVAALGVVTALLISVLQRRREMGLLRAIGASQLQVIHSVLAEACLMGVLGTGIGILVGIPLQWYVLRVVILEECGFLFPVYIPWAAGLVISIVALASATAAGLGPALYAVRQRIPEAIAYE